MVFSNFKDRFISSLPFQKTKRMKFRKRGTYRSSVCNVYAITGSSRMFTMTFSPPSVRSHRRAMQWVRKVILNMDTLIASSVIAGEHDVRGFWSNVSNCTFLITKLQTKASPFLFNFLAQRSPRGNKMHWHLNSTSPLNIVTCLNGFQLFSAKYRDFYISHRLYSHILWASGGLCRMTGWWWVMNRR